MISNRYNCRGAAFRALRPRDVARSRNRSSFCIICNAHLCQATNNLWHKLRKALSRLNMYALLDVYMRNYHSQKARIAHDIIIIIYMKIIARVFVFCNWCIHLTNGDALLHNHLIEFSFDSSWCIESERWCAHALALLSSASYNREYCCIATGLR
jgi:hypothetical protein